MKLEREIKDARFIFAKDEHSYQEVLDDMETATRIVVATYNISSKEPEEDGDLYLIDYLKKASPTADIKVFSNIPNRYGRYYYTPNKNSPRTRAKRSIRTYLTRLCPEEIGSNVSVFFSFANHGKIIMTENIAYIGSENFSEESKDNIEVGFIIKEPEFIGFLFSEVVPLLEVNSYPYYVIPLLAEVKEQIEEAVRGLRVELDAQVDSTHDRGGWVHYFDSLEQKTFDHLSKTLTNAKITYNEVHDEIAAIADGDEYVLDSVEGIRDNLNQLSRLIEDQMEMESIKELMRFNRTDYANALVQDDGEAYDDNLEDCIDRASELAEQELCDLCAEARIDLDQLLEYIANYQTEVQIIIDLLISYAQKVNPAIDNT